MPTELAIPAFRPPDPEAFALTALEFDRIRQRVAGFCACELGVRLAWNLTPSTNAATIDSWLTETEEAEVFLSREEQTLSAQGLRDIRKPAVLAGKGSVLPLATLFHIGRTCQVTNAMKKALEEASGDYPTLAGYGQALGYTNQVANRCEMCFENEETIKDTASPELRQIRRGIQEQQGAIHEKAQRLATKLYQSGVLTNPSFTLRNGRYVLPFHSGQMGKVAAVIQGTSETGATIWAEPTELLEANNKLAQLRLQEEREIERILSEVSGLVGHHAQAIVTNVEVASQIDLIIGRARLARDLHGTRPTVGPGPNVEGTAIRLLTARHPLIPKDRVVPSDIIFGETKRGLIITGPNAGGKTVALKTLGLLACMAQCGLFIPAQAGSALPLFGAVLAEIGDQQSLELDLSSFSAHISYLKRCLKFVDLYKDAAIKPLVLLDEIGRATDPQEGSAIALALTELFITAGAYFAITTHLPALKNLVIGDHPNIIGGAVSFDVEKLEPEYRLVIPGVGASYAIVLTEKMGLDPRVVARAKDFVGKRFRILELEIPALERQKAKLEKEMGDAEGKWEAMARKERHHLSLLLALQRFSLGLLTQGAEQAEEMLRDARKTVARLAQQQMSAASLPLQEAQAEATQEVEKYSELRQALEQEARGLKRAVEQPSEERAAGGVAGDIVEGSRVWVPLLRREGVVLGLRRKGKALEVSLDGKKVTLAPEEVELLGAETATGPQEAKTSYNVTRPSDVPLWLDLHGVRVLEGLEKVEEFLQGAYLARRGTVQIVHGIGTGKLRAAIHKYLRRHQLVASFREADPTEGGMGVTIVVFRE